MTGVNLIDFTMPSVSPAPAGGTAETRNVGGMKLVLPRKEKPARTGEQAEPEKTSPWWKVLLVLLGVAVLLKILKR